MILKSVSGAQWLFSCNLPRQVSVSESVYLGYQGKPQKTLQITVSLAVTEAGGGLSWEFKKL